MPGFMRVQASIGYDSLENRDVSVNVFHCRSSDVINAAVLTDVFNAFNAFYTTWDDNLSSVVGTSARIKIYNMDDPPPRFPIMDQTFTLTPAAGAATMPNEVASCLSFEGLVASGVNRRRNRGRVYLGPLAAAAGTQTGADLRPNVTFRNAVTGAANTHLMPIPGTTSAQTIEWCVFSRSNALGLAIGEPPPLTEPNYNESQLAIGYRTVIRAWIDDAFDTQRRRGLRPTLKTVVT